MEGGILIMKTRVFVMGDIHGNFKPIKDFWERNKENIEQEQSYNVLILLGDSGLNYHLNPMDRGLKKRLSKLPFTYFVIRGNHDERPSKVMASNPEEWTTEFYFGNPVYVEKDFPNIKYAADCLEVYYIPCGDSLLKTLVIPGAYSVDKHYRLQNGWNWFEGEQLTLEEMDRGLCDLELMGYNCDLVLSHTCPSIFVPTDLFLPCIDQSTVDTSMERYLGHIEYKLNYKLWCFGHYHSTRVYPLQNDTSQPLMLYNDKVINLDEWMEAISNKSIGRFL